VAKGLYLSSSSLAVFSLSHYGEKGVIYLPRNRQVVKLATCGNTLAIGSRSEIVTFFGLGLDRECYI
jgi:hypothetical protein